MGDLGDLGVVPPLGPHGELRLFECDVLYLHIFIAAFSTFLWNIFTVVTPLSAFTVFSSPVLALFAELHEHHWHRGFCQGGL